jgi:hypothetical protein
MRPIVALSLLPLAVAPVAAQGRNSIATVPPPALLWHAPVGPRPLRGPVDLWNGDILIAAGDGSLHVFEARSGKAKAVTARLDAPAIQLLGHGDGAIAIDGKGKARWIDPQGNVTAGTLALPAVPSAAATVAGGRLVVPLEGNAVVAVDLAGQSLAWSATLPGTARAAAAVGQGLVALGTDLDRLIVLGLDRGERIATVHLGGPVAVAPAIAAGLVFAGAAGEPLQGIEPRSGKVRWRAEIGRGPSADLLAVGDGVLLATVANQILWIKPNGTPRFRAPVPGRVLVQPAIYAANVVVLPHRSSSLLGYDLRTGTRSFALAAPAANDWFTTAPLVTGEMLIGLTAQGEVVAFGPRPPLAPAPPASAPSSAPSSSPSR